MKRKLEKMNEDQKKNALKLPYVTDLDNLHFCLKFFFSTPLYKVLFILYTLFSGHSVSR